MRVPSWAFSAINNEGLFTVGFCLILSKELILKSIMKALHFSIVSDIPSHKIMLEKCADEQSRIGLQIPLTIVTQIHFTEGFNGWNSVFPCSFLILRRRLRKKEERLQSCLHLTLVGFCLLVLLFALFVYVLYVTSFSPHRTRKGLN